MRHGIKINEKRIGFSKKIKRMILLEISRGVTPEDAFLKNVDISLDELSADRKYIAKLLHKWRQELYEDKEILKINYHSLSRDMLNDEIENIGNDYEYDDIHKIALERQEECKDDTYKKKFLKR